MKKTRKTIVCGLLALSLILMGTGYAFWTDTLNVTTKATTGDLDVTFADLSLFAQYDVEMTGNGWSIVDGIERDGTNGYVGERFFERGTSDYNAIAKAGTIEAYKAESGAYNSIDFDAELVDAAPIAKNIPPYMTANTNGSDQIEISVTNLYPGYAQAFRTDILNVGTLAARLSNVKFDVGALEGVEYNATTADMIGIAVLFEKESYNPALPDANVLKLCAALGNAENTFTIGGVDFLRLSALQGNDEAIMAAIENANLLAYPGSDNRTDLFLALGMDPDAEGVYTTGSTSVMNTDNDDALSQQTGVVVTLDLLWDQFNEGVEIDGTNWLARQNVGS